MKQLVDSFGRVHEYLRISVTDRCNLRCIYCMPKEGIKWKERKEILTFEEIFRTSKLFVSMGIKKIRITGGEPMLRSNIESLIADLASLKGLETLAMTTNAFKLKEKALTLKMCGLNKLNISLDTLRKDRFKAITNRDNLDDVLAGINSALIAGFTPLKLNMVVMAKVNNDEIIDFIRFIKDKPINIRFIEFMPFKDNKWAVDRFVSYSKMRHIIQKHYELVPIKCQISEVAKDFCIEGFTGTVSFITSMTENFCLSCNRIRLTADGFLKTCLFHTPESSLRDAMRAGASDNELSDMIQNALTLKKKGHEPVEELVSIENQSMIQIGG